MERRNQKTGEKEGGRKGEKEIKIEERREEENDEGWKGQRGRHKWRTVKQMERRKREKKGLRKKRRKGGGKGGREERKKGGKEQRKRGGKHPHEHPCDLTLGDFILVSHEIEQSVCLGLSLLYSFSTSLSHIHRPPAQFDRPPPPAFHSQETAFQVAITLRCMRRTHRAKGLKNILLSLPHGSAAALGRRAAATPPASCGAWRGKGAGGWSSLSRTCLGAAGGSALPPHPLAAAAGSGSGAGTLSSPLSLPSRSPNSIFFPFIIIFIILIVFKAALPQTPLWALHASAAALTCFVSALSLLNTACSSDAVTLQCKPFPANFHCWNKIHPPTPPFPQDSVYLREQLRVNWNTSSTFKPFFVQLEWVTQNIDTWFVFLYHNGTW